MTISSYTILGTTTTTTVTKSNSNPFAIGHVVNHPPEGVRSNAITTMINFTSKLDLLSKKLEHYIPNIYARSPMILGPSIVDIDTIHMHGFGLLASRDLCNEEILYDYRLSPGADHKYPDWYHICRKDELDNRWS